MATRMKDVFDITIKNNNGGLCTYFDSTYEVVDDKFLKILTYKKNDRDKVEIVEHIFHISDISMIKTVQNEAD